MNQRESSAQNLGSAASAPTDAPGPTTNPTMIAGEAAVAVIVNRGVSPALKRMLCHGLHKPIETKCQMRQRRVLSKNGLSHAAL